MAISLKHAFVSGKADSPDTTKVRASNWNAEHVMTMSSAKLLGRTTAGAGAVEEVDLVDFLDQDDLIAAIEAATTERLGLVERATVAEVRGASTDGKYPTVKDLYDAAAAVTLTDSATIAVDLATGTHFQVTLGGNRTLGNFSNVVPGKSGRIKVTQDAAGNRTLTKSSNHKLANGAGIVLSSAAGAVDFIDYDCVAADFVRLVVTRGWE